MNTMRPNFVQLFCRYLSNGIHHVTTLYLMFKNEVLIQLNKNNDNLCKGKTGISLHIIRDMTLFVIMNINDNVLCYLLVLNIGRVK